jgi:RES domain-containing protein
VRLWRISNYADLAGDGGLRAAGRWHSRGKRIVYLADHPAAALLEVLVHLEVDMDDLPASYRLHAVDIDDSVAVETIDEDNLPPNWRDDATITRAIGDKWLAESRSLLLSVPSALVPFASNWLLNPGLPDSARVRIESSFYVPYDPRLLR